jgi:phosphatidylglycerophosphatase A
MTKENNQAPNSKSQTRKAWWWLATWFGSGLAPKASGTFGSLAALPFAFLIQYYSGNLALLISSMMLFIIGWWASNEYMEYHPEKHDPKAIVVDEVVGMWLTLCGISSTTIYPVDTITPTWEYYVAGFALFRFFDVLKPWPISWADRTIKEGFGVMFDDVMAAIFAVIVFKLYLLLSLFYVFSQ